MKFVSQEDSKFLPEHLRGAG